MRFLLVNHRYAPFAGGSERYVQEVAEHRARLGDDVAVVTTDAQDLEYFWDRRARKVPAPAREHIAGVRVTRVPVRHAVASRFCFQASRRLMLDFDRVNAPASISRWLATRSPRLVDLRRALRRAGPLDAVVATNLGLEGLAIESASHAREIGAALLVVPFLHLGAGPNSASRRQAALPHCRTLLQQANAVVVMTKVEGSFVGSLGVPTNRIIVAGAGVAPHEVTGGDGARLRRRLGISGKLVGALGAMAEEKGTRHLVQAIVELRDNGAPVELVLAGPEMSSFTRWFESVPAPSRLGIHRLGIVDHETKRDLLDAIDVFAMPSRTESFGIVYLEAWANRKPVVSAAAGPVGEVVRDGVNGIVVPFADVDVLASAIDRLLNDLEAATRFGESGHGLVHEEFTWPLVLRRFDRAIDVALTNRGSFR